MSGTGDELLSPPPSTPTGDTPVRSRTPPSWVAATTVLGGPAGPNTPLTRLSPLQRRIVSPLQQRIVSPLAGRPNQVPNTNNNGSNFRERLILNYEALVNRARSNSNNRTPNRFESPLSSTPNRVSIRHEEQEEQQQEELRRTTNAVRAIRLGTGLAVGSVSHRILEETLNARSATRAITPTRSVKQNPSHRKLRRWNNDNLVGIASEIAKSHRNAKKGEALANAFLEGQAEAHLYCRINYPVEHKSAFSKLSKNDSKTAQAVKERFLKGEVASYVEKITKKELPLNASSSATAAFMYEKINSRLRNILEKSYSSNPHTLSMDLLNAFELHLISVLGDDNEWVILQKEKDNDEQGKMKKLEHALLKAPVVAISPRAGTRVIKYYFDAESSTGAFHRLLLHAVCKFHGLNSVSSDVTIPDSNNDSKKQVARVLNVSGKFHGSQLRLTDHLAFIHASRQEEQQSIADNDNEELNSKVDANTSVVVM